MSSDQNPIPKWLASAFFAMLPLATGPASAQDGYPYVIAANDGYGLQECLSGRDECGEVVAGAWCAAHGHERVLSFGPASRSPGAPNSDAASAEVYLVTCGD